MGSQHDKIIERIGKMLNCTEANGCTAAEAAACVALAHKLMLKHGLHEGDLREAHEPDMRVVWTGKRRPIERKCTSSLVRQFFNVKALHRRAGGEPVALWPDEVAWASCLVVLHIFRVRVRSAPFMGLRPPKAGLRPGLLALVLKARTRLPPPGLKALAWVPPPLRYGGRSPVNGAIIALHGIAAATGTPHRVAGLLARKLFDNRDAFERSWVCGGDYSGYADLTAAEHTSSRTWPARTHAPMNRPTSTTFTSTTSVLLAPLPSRCTMAWRHCSMS